MNMISPEAVANSKRAWLKILARYKKPDRRRSAVELAITLVPFATLWALSSVAYAHGHWWGLILILPAAGFLVRIFMIQHDCGHGSFFANRTADDWIGRGLGILTLTPYDCWRRAHATHHASAGNLDERGTGDIKTLTVAEYRQMSWRGRLAYRLYRHPLVMFGLGPIWLFIFEQRLPVGMMRGGLTPWVSSMATNVAIAVATAALVWFVGFEAFLVVHLPIVVLAGSAGIWLFYVQHQFEETEWAKDSEWEFQHAALHGSSYYDLPPVLNWFTGNIGVHHVHHLSAKVPCYRLQEVLRDYPELREIGRVTLLDSLRCVKLALWDESRSKLVSFREARMTA
ncbi:MAG: fatty acid desaturase [Mesorhizobium sp.]|uniref:fatty acid desaturase n=1 Tax=unclassified Mesorhizobium TaxID=325217 RepID=UPI000FCCC0EE|nr:MULTISPECIES: fatty acid desaturase [unclassified Mesorhizobium]RUV66593.1 fatty acid desaturase [Mesorhizobium sp. M5C.F.Cr.IN.023.01.1.1]RWF82042.1 MAG: fatty acid desaturase [Mesorhizobium sp.]RWF94520.1 MAG: fatty acid desaturase [Mesorhizobium sp.]RWI37373.1 MAG: fatty acid desaturase [Mesorhizobium sp.]RWI44635.1 MAG: fatty acid desaturase [Mesorhizobium sp.]